MPLTVYSPHSGKPVKVREEDLGRALRDEGGRVFYALKTADGQDVYGAVTRKGSPEEEARYQSQDWLTPGSAPAPGSAPGSSAPEAEGAGPANNSESSAEPHDATGPGRKAPVSRYVFIAVLVLLIAAGGYGVYRQYFCECGAAQEPLTPEQTATEALESPEQEGVPTQQGTPKTQQDPTTDPAVPAESTVPAE